MRGQAVGPRAIRRTVHGIAPEPTNHDVGGSSHPGQETFATLQNLGLPLVSPSDFGERRMVWLGHLWVGATSTLRKMRSVRHVQPHLHNKCTTYGALQ